MTDISFQPLMKTNETMLLLPGSIYFLIIIKKAFTAQWRKHAKIDGTHGVILNGWQLATLFAHDQFNRMIEWDWDDTGQLCLASAHTIYDAVTQMEWMPDFASWEQDEFRWSLPDRVLDEFAPSFWEQENVLSFMKKWFNHSLNDYLNQNKELKAKFGEKLQTLTESDDCSPSTSFLFRRRKLSDLDGNHR